MKQKTVRTRNELDAEIFELQHLKAKKIGKKSPLCNDIPILIDCQICMLTENKAKILTLIQQVDPFIYHMCWQNVADWLTNKKEKAPSYYWKLID